MPETTELVQSDRAGAVDRYARLSIVSGLLDDLSGFTDFLGELPRGWNHADKGANAVGEMCELFEALWPEEWENNGPVENMEAEARAHVMVARLLLNLAGSSDWLRERAAERLAMADGGSPEPRLRERRTLPPSQPIPGVRLTGPGSSV